jgi:hypothetical protein
MHLDQTFAITRRWVRMVRLEADGSTEDNGSQLWWPSYVQAHEGLLQGAQAASCSRHAPRPAQLHVATIYPLDSTATITISAAGRPAKAKQGQWRQVCVAFALRVTILPTSGAGLVVQPGILMARLWKYGW